MREHGVLQSNAGLLLQRLKGLCVIVLPEVLQAQADGLLFSVLLEHGWEGLLLAKTFNICK